MINIRLSWYDLSQGEWKNNIWFYKCNIFFRWACHFIRFLFNGMPLHFLKQFLSHVNWGNKKNRKQYQTRWQSEPLPPLLAWVLHLHPTHHNSWFSNHYRNLELPWWLKPPRNVVGMVLASQLPRKIIKS